MADRGSAQQPESLVDQNGVAAVHSTPGDERRSLGLASPWPFEDWGTFLPIPSTAAALLDRLLHHAVVVVTSGESWRLKEARARGRQRSTNGSIQGSTTYSAKEDLPTP